MGDHPAIAYVTGSRSAVFQTAKARSLGIDVFDIRFLEANAWLGAHHYAKADAVYKRSKTTTRRGFRGGGATGSHDCDGQSAIGR